MTSIIGKNVLVTGGTGSIGGAIVRNALANGANKVIMFSRDEIKQFLTKQRISDPKLISFVGDIRDLESIRKVFEEHHIDIVFHAAAMKHLVVCEDEPAECVKTNLIGTDNLIRLCKQYKVEHVIGISTDKASSPANVMGASKYIAERMILNAVKTGDGIYSCVRFGNVANSRGSVIPLMVRRILDGKYIWVSDPNVTRFIMRIDDAVELVMKTLEIAHGGELYILKMKAFKLGDLGEVMKERIGPKMVKKPVELKYTELVRGEKLHEELLNEMDCINLYENEEMYLIAPNTKSMKDVIQDYPSFKKSATETYTSENTEMMSKDQLETIALEYLKDEFGFIGE